MFRMQALRHRPEIPDLDLDTFNLRGKRIQINLDDKELPYELKELVKKMVMLGKYISHTRFPRGFKVSRSRSGISSQCRKTCSLDMVCCNL